ncbi:hypothetical protein KFE25_009047 [Diacronema lutheri]|uniref:DUS-like FMN-binding domain-containing protein n=1 Tax=Diacronema lutheri TaxID=2081491 RepID=A0A8J5XX21_DIALT|nr:hypothetical protein KFE25_009047 [Diacronema lutheri]
MVANIIVALLISRVGRPLLFHVAPMQCFTNVHLRVLLRSLTTKAVLWTEMEKVQDLLRSRAACRARLEHTAAEHPLVLQLGGSDADSMAQAARDARAFGFDELNINCGCPSVQAGGADFGAALMQRPALTRQLAERVAQACPGVPVSVKCRLGVCDRLGGLAEPAYEELHSFVRAISSSGAVSHVAVHARAAVLSGLSPAQNRVVPPLRPEWVHRLARDFPNLRVTLNGGIGSLEGLGEGLGAAHDDGIDGVMAGRWPLRRPLDLWAVDDEPMLRHGRALADEPRAARRARSRADAIGLYTTHVDECLSTGRASAAQLAPPLLLVVEQLRDDVRATVAATGDHAGGGARAREADALSAEMPQLVAALRDAVAILAPEPARRARAHAPWGGFELDAHDDVVDAAPSIQELGRALSKVIGTKVANKLTRNRRELSAQESKAGA